MSSRRPQVLGLLAAGRAGQREPAAGPGGVVRQRSLRQGCRAAHDREQPRAPHGRDDHRARARAVRPCLFSASPVSPVCVPPSCGCLLVCLFRLLIPPLLVCPNYGCLVQERTAKPTAVRAMPVLLSCTVCVLHASTRAWLGGRMTLTTAGVRDTPRAGECIGLFW